MSGINRENAYIFRITHIDNVAWMLSNGVHCRNSPARDPNFRTIGDPELIARRATRPVPVAPGGTLSDYVPFYFTPYSPMLYKIKTGHGVAAVPQRDIVMLVSSLPKLMETGTPFVYTDRHAYLVTAKFLTDLDDLDKIDWKLIASRSFKRDPNDLEKVERYQAEALVYRHVPVLALLGLACYNSQAESTLLGLQQAVGLNLKTVVKPDWYF